MKKWINKVLKMFNLCLVSTYELDKLKKKISVDELSELKKKTHLIGGHVFAAYGSFWSQDITQAKEFSDKSKIAIDDLVCTIENLLAK